MKVFIFAVLLAVASASPDASGEQADGPTTADQPLGPSIADQPAGPGEAETNAVLARAQHKVNYQALHYGAGVGTAPYYGVPGTDLKGVYNDGHHNAYGYGHVHTNRGPYGHGYGGYGRDYNGGYNRGYKGGNYH